jgi:hypothetical protein
MIRDQLAFCLLRRMRLGSGLIVRTEDDVAARVLALKMVCAQRSLRIAIRRQSLSLPNMISMREFIASELANQANCSV